MTCQLCENKIFNQMMEKEGLSVVTCARCGLISLDDPACVFEKENYDYYLRRVSKKREELYNPITEKRYEEILRAFEPYRKLNRILEVGCGEGHFLYAAKERRWDALGIEASRHAAQICRGFGLNVEERDLLQLAVPEGSFDAVAMMETLEHFCRPVDYLKKAATLLRKGGLFFITTPNFNCLARRLLNKDWHWIHREHLYYFTPRLLKKAMQKAGLEIITIRTKNISLPEIIAFYRGSNEGYGPVCCQYQKMRSDIEGNRYLRLSKRITNSLLNLTGLGETISCLARKS